ncbi:MAG: efflux RND transporter periplasmic adaptor subunit [Polyangiaceae bacterium]|nr:efflux RND transporter periplasmic adaptor subunit [Polyangiaceae bacterium]
MTRRWLAFGLLAVSCTTSDAAPSHAPTPRKVETVQAVSRTLSVTDSLPAELAAYQAVDVYPKVTGFVDEVWVDVGSRVKKGDLMMRLAAPELVAQKAQAQAAVESARSQLATARAKLAAEQGTSERLVAAARTPGVVAGNDVAIAQQTAEAARGVVGAAEHNVSASQDALRAVTQLTTYLEVRAPFDGIITKRNVHPGALVGPAAGPSAAPSLRLVDSNRLRLVVPVPEAQSSAIKLGAEVPFGVPAYPGMAFTGSIARVSHDIDLQTRTMRVELEVDNANGKLAAGSYATVSWPVQRAYPTLFVPVSAVTSDQQSTFVIRVAGDKAEWVTVKVGQVAGAQIEVVGDVRPGDAIVVNATDSIRNGEQVTAVAAPQSGGGA